jgi:type II secretory pathway pseudopilin PulG
MKKDGFTLIECLLGLALSLFVISTGFEFFIRAEKAFLRLKEREEAGQAALAALDRMRIDLLHAGRGLVPEIGLGLIEAAETAAGELRTASLEKGLTLVADIHAGDTRLPLASATDITAGQQIVLREGAAGEVRTVVRVDAGGVLVDAPVGRNYIRDAASLSLVERVTYFLDAAGHILRRRVNASPAQPLLEDVARVEWSLDTAAPLIRIRLELDDPAVAGTQGAHPHETTVFLKNPALAEIPR